MSGLDQAVDHSDPVVAGTAGGAPRGFVPQLRRVERKARREATRWAALSFQQLPPREAVRMAYNVLLRREPDEPAWTEQAEGMARGELTHADLVDRVRASSEYRTQVPILSAGLHVSLHASRSEFIIGLPPARRIVDLGGGATWDARGALVALGYPYDFDELVIVDLPPTIGTRSTTRSASGPTGPIGDWSATSTGPWPTCRSPTTGRWTSSTAASPSST